MSVRCCIHTACTQCLILLTSPMIPALAEVTGSRRALTGFMQLQHEGASPQAHILNSCFSTSLILQTGLGNPLDTKLVRPEGGGVNSARLPLANETWAFSSLGQIFLDASHKVFQAIEHLSHSEW